MKQLSIDFRRAEQLELLGTARIDSTAVGRDTERDRVRGATMRSVLRVIDDFGRGSEAWPSIQTISERSGISVRQVNRAIAALESISVLCVEKRRNRWGVVTNHYTIVWSELALLATKSAPAPVPAKRAPVPGRAPDTAADSASDRCAGPSDRCAGPSDRCAGPSDRCAGPAYKALETLRNATSANGGGGDVSLVSGNAKAISSELQSLGVRCSRRVLTEAKQAGLSLGELQSILAEYRSNQSKFSSPGAILERIRAGGWPVEIKTQSQVAEKATLDAEKRRKHEVELLRDKIIKAGRKAKVSDEVIEQRIRAAFDHFGFSEEPAWV